MAMCNIPSTNTDPQYRYKMPRIVTKVEGRGIGLKTRIVNMSEVAHALYRPPQYIMKWFGSELGAGTTCGDLGAIINGEHDSQILQSLLDQFIEKYVLCPGCDLPEIDLRIKKGALSAKCKACGWSGELDNCHKIVAFLVRNPIDSHGNIVDSYAQGDTQDKKAKRAAKIAAQQAKSGDLDKDRQKKEKNDKKASKLEEEGDEHGKEKKDKKAEDAKGKKGNKDKSAKADGGSKDGKHVKVSSDAARDSVVPEFDDDEITSTIQSLTDFVESKCGNPTRDDFFTEVRVLQVAKAFDHRIRLYIVLRTIFPCAMDAKGLGDKAKLLDKFITKCALDTKDILWAFDRYIDAKNDLDASRFFPPILKVLYDEEWCTEEGILSYYNDDEGAGEPGFEKAKASAKPFLTWLAQDVVQSDSDSAD